ncbi:MAG: DEAD/DEAH box helicase [Pseudomonadota bacterium]
MQFSSADLIDFFGHHTFGKGLDYARQQRVLELRVRNEAHPLELGAQVQGSGRAIYSVHVLVAGRGRRLFFENDCSCPVGVDCKHVVATLIEYLRQGQSTAPADAAATASPVARWLQELAPAAAAGEAESQRLGAQCLAYVLAPAPGGVEVKPFRTRLKPKGGYAEPRKALGYFDTDVASYHRKGHHQDLDLRILGGLRVLGISPGGGFVLRGEVGAELLTLLLRSGRCHWQDLDTTALAVAAPLAMWAAWERHEGQWRLALQWPRPGLLPLPLTPPWYYDPVQHCCGPLETPLPGTALERLHDSPALSKAEVEAHAVDLVETLSRLKLPLPPTIEVERLDGITPQPRLQLYRALLAGGDGQPQPVAELDFDYAGHWLPGDPPAPWHRQQEAGRLLEILRDTAFEDRCRAALAALPPGATLASGRGLPPQLRLAPDTAAWLEFMDEALPALRAQGWRIEVEADFEFQALEIENWYGELDDMEGGSAWFDLELGVIVNGQRLNLLPLLTAALARLPAAELAELPLLADSETLAVSTGQGVLRLPMARLRPLLATLVELFDPGALEPSGRLRLSRQDSARLPDLPLPWEGAAALRALGARLRDFQGLPAVAPPTDFGAELRPYQQTGLDWLQFLRDHGLNGVLADDMGLGKTVQALAHLLLEKQAGRLDRPCLVLAPTSLMHNWRREAARFAPQLRVLLLHGSDRRRHMDAIAEHDIVLTTYPLLVRDAEALQAQKFHYVILDEAQVLKNPKAKATLLVQQLQARHRLALTGTPMENHLGELWSLFNILMPGLLGSQTRFNKLFRQPIEQAGDVDRRAALARRVAPFLLRRRKEQVATELPPKTEILRSVSLDGAQRDLYESIRLSMDKKLRAEIDRRGFARSRIMILDALLKLRQVCCDPRLLALESARQVKGSAKLELLMDLLPELLEEGRRVLLFSQFTSMLALIEAELDARALPYVKLTGQTRDRATPVQRFQDGEVPLFLISLKAGGTGLNLTAADTVIHYDPWWNPAVEQQATDRAHRIGQDKPVFVYKLLTEGTVEEKILALQARKAALAQGIYGEREEKGPGFDTSDLEELLRPLA